MNNKTDNLFRCLVTGEKLKPVENNSSFLENLLHVFEKSYNQKVDYFFSNESLSYFYPVCCGVIILLDGFILNKRSKFFGNQELNPFSESMNTDPNWYMEYDNLVSFKKNEIKKVIDKFKGSPDILVEHLSSSGTLISFLKNKIELRFKKYIATDLDFYALKELKNREKEIIAVCCDSSTNIFQENIISIVVSNSVHHIHDRTTYFYKNVYRSLQKDGRFIGIESQGFLARLIILLIFITPKRLIPYAIKEIYNERDLLMSWHRVSIIKRLKGALIDSFEIKKYLFHAMYILHKK